MGQDIQFDVALDYRILHKILIALQDELFLKDTTLQRRRWIAVVGAHFTISFVQALQGNETLMLDLKALIEYFQEGLTEEIPHVVVPLLGQFNVITFY